MFGRVAAGTTSCAESGHGPAPPFAGRLHEARPRRAEHGPQAPVRPTRKRIAATALELRGTWHWGGWSDAAADAWHRALSFDDFARPAFPSDQVRLQMQGLDAPSPVDIQSATFAFGDVVIRNQLLLWEGGEPLAAGPAARAGVSLRVDVKVPSGSPSRMGGSGGWDVGLGLEGTWQATSWLVGHAIASGSYWSELPGGLPLRPRPLHASVGLSLVALAGEWSFVLENRWSTAAFRAGWAFVEANPAWNVQSSAYAAVAMPQNQITGGVRRGPLTFWVMEDFCPGRLPGLRGWFYDTNAPDLAIGLTVTLHERSADSAVPRAPVPDPRR